MSKHTPGPWRLEKCPCDWEKCNQYFAGPVRCDGRYEESDARLIAAAPDLLAALEELVSRRERAGSTHGTRNADGSDGRYARARAAIARARGGQ